MTNVLVPIAICCILPICVVWIIFHAATNGDNKRAGVLIKAIESNNGIDADRLADALAKPKKSARELLNLRLLRGCIFTFLGVASGVVAAIFAHTEPEAHIENGFMIASAAFLAIGISYLIVYFVSKKQ